MKIIADTMAKKDNEPYPIDFPMFVQHMAAILVYVSARAAKTDVPAVCLGGDVLGGGKGKTKVCETDLVDILTGRDLVRRRIVITQLSRFLEWLVEQEKIRWIMTLRGATSNISLRSQQPHPFIMNGWGLQKGHAPFL